MNSFEWKIEDIADAHPALSLDHAMVMAVVLMRHAGSPCRFIVNVDGIEVDALDAATPFALDIAWNTKTESLAKRMERTEQRTPIVERAAIAVAVLLISHLLPNSRIEVLKQSERADYWLPERHEAVEISGTEHASEVNRRRREKERQVLENPYGMDGHVLVCCFEDTQCIIQWSYVRQSE
jgi:hypothetical protein